MKFTFPDTKKYQNWTNRLQQQIPTMVESNMAKMQANMHIRKIARQRNIDFEALLIPVVMSDLYMSLVTRISYKLNAEPILDQIRNHETI